MGCLDRPASLIEIIRDQMENCLGVGLRLELVAFGRELVPKLLEVLDDAVVNHSHAVIHVGVGIALDRPTMRRPARVANAGPPFQRLL